MFTVNVEIHDINKVNDSIRELGRRFPVAVAKALTFTAERVRDRLVDEMKTVFDRPTPFTLKSLYLKTATATDLTAAVFMKDKKSGATCGAIARDWLGPEIFGGYRKRKRFEKALLFHGVMNTRAAYTMPGANAEIDKYGGMSRSQINRMLSYFQAAERTAGVTRNTSAKKKAALAKGTRSSLGITYFAVKSMRGHLHPGIYSKVAGRIRPVMVFVKKPTYRSVFDFDEIGEVTANKVWPDMIHDRIEKEIQRLGLR